MHPVFRRNWQLYGEHHTYTYRTEDIDDYIKSVDMLGVGSYHVVVGNPPYITVKDKQESDDYRKAYESCSGSTRYRFRLLSGSSSLLIRGALDGAGAGYTVRSRPTPS